MPCHKKRQSSLCITCLACPSGMCMMYYLLHLDLGPVLLSLPAALFQCRCQAPCCLFRGKGNQVSNIFAGQWHSCSKSCDGEWGLKTDLLALLALCTQSIRGCAVCQSACQDTGSSTYWAKGARLIALQSKLASSTGPKRRYEQPLHCTLIYLGPLDFASQGVELLGKHRLTTAGYAFEQTVCLQASRVYSQGLYIADYLTSLVTTSRQAVHAVIGANM